jgi:cyclase
VRRVAEAIRVPLIVGGGVGSLDDIQRLLDAGASACSMNSAAVKNPDIVNEAAQRFGSEPIIVAIDGRKNADMPSGYEVVTHGGTRGAGMDCLAWAAEVANRGAGQILPTSMETDGVKDGYDIPLTRGCAEASGLPIIASGGAGKLEHFLEAVCDGQASALLAASVFHFGELSIRQVKEYLRDSGVTVRL